MRWEHPSRGNVSFYNETLGEGIYPTPTVGIAHHGDVTKVSRRTSREPAKRCCCCTRGDAAIPAEFGSSSMPRKSSGSLGVPPALDLTGRTPCRNAWSSCG